MGTEVLISAGLHHTAVSGMNPPIPSSIYLILEKAPMYYRNANCAVVVYDITQSASLEKARNWIRELQRQADPSIVIALCGNKSDLAARRQVTQEEAQKYAQEEGLMWAETSAKTGEGVTDIFNRIGQSLPTTQTTYHLSFIHRSQETSYDCTTCTKRWHRSGGHHRRQDRGGFE
jgi:GTPase SAR1 family protein